MHNFFVYDLLFLYYNFFKFYFNIWNIDSQIHHYYKKIRK